MRKWLASFRGNGPTREGWYYLFIWSFVCGGALLRDINLLLLLSGMFGAPLVWNGILAGWVVFRARVRRRLPSHATAGEAIRVEIKLEVRPGSARVIAVHERIHRDSVGRSQPQAIPVKVLIPSGASQGQAAYEIKPPTRGRYRWDPLRISTTHPWGLARRTRRSSESAELIVYPAQGELLPGWRGERRDRGTFQGSAVPRTARAEGEFYALRDWRAGDSSRWIHWRTSARLGRPMVRQFEQRRAADLIVLVDLWQPLSPAPQHLDAVEQAVSLAATIWNEACRAGGSRVVLALAGQEIECVRGDGSQQAREAGWERLALAAADGGDSGDAALKQASSMTDRNAQILWITTRQLRLTADDTQSARDGEVLTSGRIRYIAVGSSEYHAMFIAPPHLRGDHESNGKGAARMLARV